MLSIRSCEAFTRGMVFSVALIPRRLPLVAPDHRFGKAGAILQLQAGSELDRALLNRGSDCQVVRSYPGEHNVKGGLVQYRRAKQGCSLKPGVATILNGRLNRTPRITQRDAEGPALLARQLRACNAQRSRCDHTGTAPKPGYATDQRADQEQVGDE